MPRRQIEALSTVWGGTSTNQRLDVAERRFHIDRINLLSRLEVETLFPGCEIYVERPVFAKSCAARWMPDEPGARLA